MNSRSDEYLIETIINQGQTENFSELYNRYRSRVLDKCFGMTRNKALADDLTQDIFVKALEKLSGFKGQSTFSTWLYAITYHHCIEYLRKHKRVRFDDWASVLDIPDDVDDEDVAQVLDLAEERLTLILELLKPEDKAIILMKYMERMTIKQIKEIFQLSSESAAKMKITRARQRIVALHNQFYTALDT
ncbi:MAG: RNA polymerase sigma factor [Flavobacteriales bacterium]|nr:RNA polymerase sigma factor [Flavobacteriales bacterium]